MTSRDYMYQKIKKGGRKLFDINDYIDASILEHEDCIKKSKEKLIKTVSNSNRNISK